MVTFTYPYPTPSLTVALPNPSLGDAVQHEYQTKFGIAASGRVYTYIKTPGNKQLLLRFINLSYTQMNDLKNLIYSSAGNQIGYLDHELNQWVGQCMNDPFEERGTKYFQQITLEFAGVIQ